MDHIADESEVAEKRGSVAPARPRAQTSIQPQRVLETMGAKKDQRTRHPYDPRKNKGRGPGRPREYNCPSKYKFVMGLADLIAIPNIAARLKAPEKVGDNDGDQAQEDMEANQQDQEEVEAQIEDAHGGQSPPQRITRSMFKALGARGHLFSLFCNFFS